MGKEIKNKDEWLDGLQKHIQSQGLPGLHLAILSGWRRDAATSNVCRTCLQTATLGAKATAASLNFYAKHRICFWAVLT